MRTAAASRFHPGTQIAETGVEVDMIKWAGSFVSVALASLALGGCGLSTPRVAYIKSPEPRRCVAKDCPTIELPAPNSDDRYNPGELAMLDGQLVTPPAVLANDGRVWYVMPIQPGKHSIDVGCKNVGIIGKATKPHLELDAQPGQRYWVFARPSVGGVVHRAWIESADAARTVLAGERNLEPHSMAAGLIDDPKKDPKVEEWWIAAPALDQQIFRQAEKVGDVPPPAPAVAAQAK
jgi:hypothetical protein